MEVVINTVAKPMQIGFYKDGILVETKEYSGLTSDILLPILKDIVKKFDVKRFIYVSGPGSHMATKIVYVALKSIEILTDIKLSAISAFELNNNKPIKALGKLYFIKEKETIITRRFDNIDESIFFMPKNLSDLKILDSSEPDYNISAVN